MLLFTRLGATVRRVHSEVNHIFSLHDCVKKICKYPTKDPTPGSGQSTVKTTPGRTARTFDQPGNDSNLTFEYTSKYAGE